jgi:four helix bundle protein
MDKNELKKRTKQLAVNTGWLCLKLPFNAVNKEYVSQLVRSSSSGGANYRAACRAKSKPDFINKLRIVEEELDESMYFFELLAEFNPTLKDELRGLYKEADELLSIIITSINTSLKNLEIEKQSEKSVRKNLKS